MLRVLIVSGLTRPSSLARPSCTLGRWMAGGLLGVVCFAWTPPCLSQPTSTPSVVPLWPDGPPDDNGLSGEEQVGGCTGNISHATLTLFLPAPDKATGAAIVIMPGGGYKVVCDDTEGKQIADLLTPRGIAAIVVKYRLPNGRSTIPANDARRAIRTVRHNAAKWNIDPQRVGVWGFSAGGHLASTVSTVFDDGRPEATDPIERLGSRPDFSILFYPVISLDEGVTHAGSRDILLGINASSEMIQRYSSDMQVTPATPPTFLLHAADDKVVPIENSLRYFSQLLRHGVSARMAAFELGGHGPEAFQKNPSWLAAFEEWLRRVKAM